MSRTVLITGAGTGIGRATALLFAERGDNVVIVGRRAEPLAEVAVHDGAIHAIATDITGPGAPERIVAEAVERFGGLDVLVNNAGIVRDEPMGGITPDAVSAQLATNFTAPVLLTQAAVPHLRRDNGVVVNVSTAVALRGWPTSSVYAATKAAVDTFTRSWAVELAPLGVRVVAVAPGAIDTPIAEHQGLSPEQRAATRAWQMEHTPLKRVGSAEEVAWAITGLASPSAGFVTGVVLPVDGGAVVA
ncbi:SDR family oxidoreductase [Allokutzneria sp. A3M-2-11 16]|uniref:SDR family NAD(P)-dependent oxidoreductase n=1 Tax=Allokutzneria sp. A3M-2-11 16 TaxID=2962043 RepID=UPI0020B68F88|nr:SDR family oxidoreductase [Allokutzneria sp. A3M-2-11 16]MCP3805188.1 SDR family oxidoreductase [Allokutzneria sp. A3M-2-11 16]